MAELYQLPEELIGTEPELFWGVEDDEDDEVGDDVEDSRIVEEDSTQEDPPADQEERKYPGDDEDSPPVPKMVLPPPLRRSTRTRFKDNFKNMGVGVDQHYQRQPKLSDLPEEKMENETMLYADLSLDYAVLRDHIQSKCKPSGGRISKIVGSSFSVREASTGGVKPVAKNPCRSSWTRTSTIWKR